MKQLVQERGASWEIFFVKLFATDRDVFVFFRKILRGYQRKILTFSFSKANPAQILKSCLPDVCFRGGVVRMRAYVVALPRVM